MPFNLKVSGVWKAASPFVRVTGAWKAATAWLRVSGVWKVVSVLFNPLSGVYADYAIGTASYTITCAIPATWTWSKTGAAAGSSNVVSGGVATSITFSIVPPGVTGTQQSVFTVSGTAGGVTENYTITVTAEKI